MNTFSPILSGSPFNGLVQKSTPEFLFNFFKPKETAKISAFYSILEVAFDNIYQKVYAYPDQLNPRTANAKMLHQLGSLLGLEIDDLSKYLDEEGNLLNPSETIFWVYGSFDDYLERQRAQVIHAVESFLMKGTKASVIRLLQNLGIVSIEVKDLWTVNLGDFFEINNALVTFYGDSLIGDLKNVLYSEESVDLMDEMTGLTPAVSGVKDFQANNYDYKYVLDLHNNLYYKPSEDNWYYFNPSSISELSNGIAEIKVRKDKVYIRSTDNKLAILNYKLESISVEHRVSTSNCYFFDFIDKESKILLDRGTRIEVRDSMSFLRIGSPQNKPESFTITSVVRKNDKELYLLNSNGNFYRVRILNRDTALICDSTLFNFSFSPNSIVHHSFFINNVLALIKMDNSSVKYITFDDNGTATSSVTTISLSGSLSNVKKIVDYYGTKVVIGADQIGTIEVPKGYVGGSLKLEVFDYVTSGSYSNIFLTDKFYLYTNASTSLKKIIGWNRYTDKKFMKFDGVDPWNPGGPQLTWQLDGNGGRRIVHFYENDVDNAGRLAKVHYFDVNISVDSSFLDRIELVDIKDLLVEQIEQVKPIHTKVRNVNVTVL